MKTIKISLLLACFLLFGTKAYCQPHDIQKYQRYANQAQQEIAREMKKIMSDLDRSSQFAMRSTNKDIYVLYLEGNEVACFSDEFSCKAQINHFKLRVESIIENSFIKNCPAEYRSELRNVIKKELNNLNFTYKRQANPNYQAPIEFSNKKQYEPQSSYGSFQNSNNETSTKLPDENKTTKQKEFQNVTKQEVGSFFQNTNQNTKNEPIIAENNITPEKSFTITSDDFKKNLESYNFQNNKALQNLEEIADKSKSVNLNDDAEKLYMQQVEISNMLPQSSLNVSGAVPLNVNNMSELGAMESGHAPEWTFTEINIENIISSQNTTQVSKNEEIKPENPYIELTAGTAKALIGLAGTAHALIAIPTVNIWKENYKAYRDWKDYGKIPSTTEILCNAFWGKNGEVPIEILSTYAGDKAGAWVMKKGSGYMIKNAGKYGREPYRVFETMYYGEKIMDAAKTGGEEGYKWGEQISKDLEKSQQKEK